MTTQKTLKRKIRARMEKTGESYAAARRAVLAASDGRKARPGDGRRSLPPRVHEPEMSEEAVVRGTGHGWDHWLALLDAWDASAKPHKQIARWLSDEHGVDGWWAQSITVGYERARGLRAPGQRPDGFSVSATKTIAVPVEVLYDAWTKSARRRRWLPDADLRVRTSRASKGARFDWDGGPSRVVVHFDTPSDGKSRVTVAHERLPDAQAAEEMKAFWRGRVAALKTLLENDAAAR